MTRGQPLADPVQGAALLAGGIGIDGDEGGVLDSDSHLLDRRHQEILAVLLLQDRREEPHQRGPADGEERRAHHRLPGAGVRHQQRRHAVANAAEPGGSAARQPVPAGRGDTVRVLRMADIFGRHAGLRAA